MCIFVAVGGTISAEEGIGLELVVLLSGQTANCWFIMINKASPHPPGCCGYTRLNVC